MFMRDAWHWGADPKVAMALSPSSSMHESITITLQISHVAITRTSFAQHTKLLCRHSDYFVDLFMWLKVPKSLNVTKEPTFVSGQVTNSLGAAEVSSHTPPNGSLLTAERSALWLLRKCRKAAFAARPACRTMKRFLFICFRSHRRGVPVSKDHFIK